MEGGGRGEVGGGWREEFHSIALFGFVGAGGMNMVVTWGNHFSGSMCVDSDENSDAGLISYANSDAQLNLNTGHNYRC